MNIFTIFTWKSWSYRLRKSCSWVATIVLLFIPRLLIAQVGIGTTFPKAKLHVFEGSVFANSKQPDPVFNTVPPTDSIQHIFKWFHERGALRSSAERPGTGSFELDNIGPLSFASGYETFAIGQSSVAFGVSSYAFNLGSFALGRDAFSAGLFSVAIGDTILSNGSYSFAQGFNVTADADHTVAMGTKTNTNGHSGSFIFGDASSGISQNDANNQMMMRFAGGYKLFTNALNLTGVQLGPGANAWSVVSDVHKKENFAPVNGESFLQKIIAMNLTSWNYKGQDSKIFRHYGPMAQDFFRAFGEDQYGRIGTDTTINQADFDGVNFIAIQALIKRTEHLQTLNDQLQSELLALKREIRAVRTPSRRKASLITAR